MPSHFSAIGIPVNSEDDLMDMALRAARASQQLPAEHGVYLHWSSSSGAELWLQVSEDAALIGANPHFVGESIIRVMLTRPVSRPDNTVLDGAYHGWADPSGDDPESGTYPFVFDAPDFHLYPEFSYPCLVEAQIAAFAHEVQVYDTPEAYHEAQTEEPRFGSQSFIPAGLFAMQEPDQPPLAYAIISGHVITAERRHNELTDGYFYWAMIETLGGRFDVVVPPELLETLPSPGNVISGSFWLSGRLISYPKSCRSFFSKLFRRD